jgi:secreted trypsin-like serine protease
MKLKLFVITILISECLKADPIIMRPFSESFLAEKISFYQAPSISNAFTSSVTENYQAVNRDLVEYKPFVYGGKIVDETKYPALLWYVSNQTKCSASQVGPNVIITAAHCLIHSRNNSNLVNASIELKNADGTQYTINMKCTINPEYKSNNIFPDWALCLMDKERIISTYEYIYTGIAKENMNVSIAGYGCKRIGEERLISNSLTIGTAKISPPAPGYEEKFIWLSDRKVAACVGDSGGPSFIDLPTYGRVIIGVNSRSNPRQAETQLAGFSNPAFDRFYNYWIEKLEEKPVICGINGNSCNR